MIETGKRGRNESHMERCDRNLVELLQEVRVAQTGIQVLFAFLLALAFTSRFAHASNFERIDYFASLVCTGAAALLFMAPTSYHRLLFRQGDKEHLVAVANRFVIAGLGVVAASLVGVVLLVTDLVLGSGAAVAAAAVAACCCLVRPPAAPPAPAQPAVTALTRALASGGPGTEGVR
jgi:uncharacterized protein DUF6328